MKLKKFLGKEQSSWPSAVWQLAEIPEILILQTSPADQDGYPVAGKNVWRVGRTGPNNPQAVKAAIALLYHTFSTRREALQAVEIVLMLQDQDDN